MVSLDSRTPVSREQEDTTVIAHNSRMGVILFIVYVLFYGGFMALSAFAPDVMSQPFAGGANLAVVYGFSLIVVALVLALLYMKLCRKTAK